MNLQPEYSRVIQVDEPNDWQTIGSDNNITFNKSGYVYVFHSAESDAKVYFDNAELLIIKGKLIEENHYYPYGLKIGGLSKTVTNKVNNYGYQSKEINQKEFSTGLGLNLYDFDARMYDPQIGRWNSVDPLADQRVSLTPYNAMSNNPINRIDPDGQLDDWVGCNNADGSTAYHWDDNIKSEEQAKAAGFDAYKAPGSIIDNANIGGAVGGDGKTSVYLGYNKNDVSFTYPNSTITPFQVGTEWLSGNGPRNRSFTNGDNFTEMLRQHDHIIATKDLVAGAVANGTMQGNNPYTLGGVEGSGKYVKDYSTLLTGGATGNLAVTYLGSYNLKWQVTGVAVGSATVQFSVSNSSTMQSASRPPILEYYPWWQNSVGSYINQSFQTGWGSRTTQTFNWTETIPVK